MLRKNGVPYKKVAGTLAQSVNSHGNVKSYPIAGNKALSHLKPNIKTFIIRVDDM